jgi:hypothetical protein
MSAMMVQQPHIMLVTSGMPASEAMSARAPHRIGHAPNEPRRPPDTEDRP